VTQLGFHVMLRESSAALPVAKPIAQCRPRAAIVTVNHEEKPLIPRRKRDSFGRPPRIETHLVDEARRFTVTNSLPAQLPLSPYGNLGHHSRTRYSDCRTSEL
jgi:hypothetical protein